MLYLIGAAAAFLAAGFFLTGTKSLIARDEYGKKQPIDDAHAYQMLNHVHQNQHQNPF